MVRAIVLPAPLRSIAFFCLVLAGCREAGDEAPPAAPAAEATFCSRLEAAAEVFELADPTPPERRLRGGEAHAYRFDLDRGEFAEVVVDQRGVDVMATLLGPGGEPLVAADGLTGAAGAERLPWRSDEAARYHLLVCAFGGPERTGRYQARIERRPAEEADLTAVGAALAYSTAENLRRRGEPRPAVVRYLRALELWEELGDPRQLDALYRLGQTHDRSLGEWRSAIGFYRRALPLFAERPNPAYEASALHALGRSHYRLGEIEQAVAPYERARELRRELGDLHGEAVTSNDLGLAYDLLGDVPGALAAYDLALDRWGRLGDRAEEATTFHNRGQTYHGVGDHEQALADLERALAIRRALGDRRRAETLTAIGKVHRTRGDLRAALRCHAEALALAEEAGDRRLEAMILNSQGVALIELGQAEEALSCYRRALPIFEQLGDRRHQAILRHNLGWLTASLDRSEEALGYYRQALQLKEEIRDTRRLATTLWGMALAERRRGRLTAARGLIEEALDEIEDLRARPASQELRASFFATKQDYYDFDIDLLMELHHRDPAAGYAAAALAVSERARARSQLDALADSGADRWPGADPASRERLRELEREIGRREAQRRRLLEGRPTEEQLAAVERQLHELLRQLRRVRSELRSSGGGGLAEPPLVDAGDIQDRILDDRTLLLEYDLGPERSYLWAVDRDGIAGFELPAREEIEAAARRGYELLTRSQGRKWKAQTDLTLARLSDLLLAPVAGRLDEERLLIAAEGALHYLPFAALPAPAAGESGGAVAGEPLVSRHEIVNIPSASTLAALRRRLERRSPAPGALAVIADPVFAAGDPRVIGPRTGAPRTGGPRTGAPETGATTAASGFERLAHSRREAETILALLEPDEERFAAFDFAAGRDAVTGELGRYRILHLATHAELDSEHPELSRLVFALVDEEGQPRDGFLYGHQIYNLHLPAELVVLSACRTALGKEIRGEGLVGLTQAFFYAGAARVIVSLWDVDDRATAELMELFYRNLLHRDLRPAAALRAAQDSIRRQRRWRAEHFWAGFVLQGEWR